MWAGRGPNNDDEGFFVSADFKCFRKRVWVWVWEGGPPMMVKEALFLWGWGVGPLMMAKDSLFLLISNVLGRGCGAGRGPTHNGEGFSISAYFKYCKKGV